MKGRDLLLWPDHDEAGHAAMEQVHYQATVNRAKSIRRLDTSELAQQLAMPRKFDADDVLMSREGTLRFFELADKWGLTAGDEARSGVPAGLGARGNGR